jgi:uncharacterized membrane protein
MTRASESLIIKGTPEKLYDIFRQVEKFPQFIEELKSVEPLDGGKYRMTVTGSAGQAHSLITQITTENANRRIAWKTLEGDFKTSGQVTFLALPNDQTEVSATIHLEPEDAAGAFGGLAEIADKRLLDYLQNFKRYTEGMQERLPDQE